MKLRSLSFILGVIVLGIFGLVLINGCKKKPDPPAMTTATVTGITINSAASGGNITGDGGAEVTARGICWGTTHSPVVTGSHTSDGNGTGTFSSALTDLQPNTLYYVRAYATNSAGTGFGNELSFTTNPLGLPELSTEAVTSVTPTAAVSGGSITTDGGASVTVRGVCWGAALNPTTADSKTADGSGTGTYTSNLTGLVPGTAYHVRAYATNSVGTSYGNDLTFTSASTTATITTATIGDVTRTSASSGGNITTDGGSPITARGVCWSTSPSPLATGAHSSDGSGTGSFTSPMTGLSPNTQYYVRAYATNSAGTAYGNELPFTTDPLALATLTTTSPNPVASTTAVSGGNITSDGGASITARGVCWSLTLNPTISGSKSSDGNGTGTFTSNLTGLQPGTLYHIRAYATNNVGTAYGNDLTFTTTAVAPSVTTAIISGITQTSATSGGNVTASGGATVTARGVCWKTSANPVVTDSHTSDGSGTGSFTSSLTGLTAETEYHVRAYATNSMGTSYGNEVVFTAQQINLATLTTAVISSVTTNSAASGGNITSDGGGSVTGRGICWSTSQNPVITDQHTSNGSGTGSFTSSMTGLSNETQYFVRAYATNSAGTAYGNQISFSSSTTDVEGNIYKTVVIGNQMWMSENLRTTTYNDHGSIPNVTDNGAWTTLTTPAYSWYGNDIANKPINGAIYNWYTIETGNLCPTGWHVPSDNEFKTLETYLGMASDQLDLWDWRGTNEGTKLKTTSGWDGTNTSGFTGLPSGYRFAIDGYFYSLGTLTYWWSSSLYSSDLAWYRRMDSGEARVYRGAVSIKGGKYVRCLKD
jgi:uncharacterized protein (TIGR02145 family)